MKLIEFPVQNDEKMRETNAAEILARVKSGEITELYITAVTKDQNIIQCVEHRPSCTGIGGMRILEGKALSNWLEDWEDLKNG